MFDLNENFYSWNYEICMVYNLENWFLDYKSEKDIGYVFLYFDGWGVKIIFEFFYLIL